MSKMKAVYGEPKDNYTASLRVKSTILTVWFVILTIICLLPIYILIVNATRESTAIANGVSFIPGTNLGKNISKLFGDINYNTVYNVWIGYKNSLIITGFSTIFTVFFSAMTAYGIYMYNFKFKKFSFRFIMAVMMVPSQVSTLGFIRLLDKMHLMESYVGLIVPSIAAPIVFFYMFQSMEATLPYSIVEAARVDGCNEFRTFNQIAIPMLKPAFAVQAIFAFVTSWNNYFIPSLVLTEKAKWTVPIVIAAARNADYMNNDQGISYMLMTLAIVPLTIVYFILSKYIIEGTAAGGVKE